MDYSYNNRRIVVSNAASNVEKRRFSGMSLVLRLDEMVGVYAIVCKATNSAYIGQSKNIKGRIKNHKSLLKQGRHSVPRMQLDYNVHGAGSFTFERIHQCDESFLLHWETEYIREYMIRGYEMYNAVLETHGYTLLQVSHDQKKVFDKILKALNKGHISLEALEMGIDNMSNIY